MINCPICGVEAAELDRTSDAEGYDCPRHGKFKVSRTALSIEQNIGPEQWERALARARGRAKAGEWPILATYDF